MLISLIFQKKVSLIVSAIVIVALLSSINISNDYYELTTHNRSVYAIGFPHRENLLAKEDC